MKNFIYSWGTSLVLLLVIDSIWLGMIALTFYKTQLGYILSGNLDYAIAASFYALYAFGISYFVILPCLRDNAAISRVMLNGFLLGLVAYCVYDLRNHASIRDWPAAVTVMDMLWGALFTAVVSAGTYKIMRSSYTVVS